MAGRKKRVPAPAPVADDAGVQAAGINPSRHDDDRTVAGRVRTQEADPVGAWERVSARLSEIERVGNPVCLVTVDFTAPAVWAGIYGGAVITQGIGRFARTADGGTHQL